MSPLRVRAAVVVAAAFAGLAACTGSGTDEDTEGSPPADAGDDPVAWGTWPASSTPEDPAGLRAVQRADVYVFPAPDGSVLLHYDDGPRRDYYRHLTPDGLLSGFAGPTPEAAWVLPFENPMGPWFSVEAAGQAMALTGPGQFAPVTISDEQQPMEPGDVVLPSHLTTVDLGSVYGFEEESDAGSTLAVYRPGERLFFPVDTPAAVGISDAVVDDEGNPWVLSWANEFLHSTDGGGTWARPHLAGGELGGNLNVAGSTVYVESSSEGTGRVRRHVSNDRGQTWNESVVSSQQSDLCGWETAMLEDGRLLCTSGGGELARATSAENATFEALPDGPIDTVVVAGHLVYGLSDDHRGPWAGHLWVSSDAGSTWTEVLNQPGLPTLIR